MHEPHFFLSLGKTLENCSVLFILAPLQWLGLKCHIKWRPALPISTSGQCMALIKFLGGYKLSRLYLVDWKKGAKAYESSSKWGTEGLTYSSLSPSLSRDETSWGYNLHVCELLNLWPCDGSMQGAGPGIINLIKRLKFCQFQDRNAFIWS